jgi:hypothetical protein
VARICQQSGPGGPEVAMATVALCHDFGTASPTPPEADLWLMPLYRFRIQPR